LKTESIKEEEKIVFKIVERSLKKSEKIFSSTYSSYASLNDKAPTITLLSVLDINTLSPNSYFLWSLLLEIHTTWGL